jgi:hypothetical protein
MRTLRVLTLTVVLGGTAHLIGASLKNIFKQGGTTANLVVGPDGVLYGTTGYIVFSLTPPTKPGKSWTETILYNVSDGFEEAPVALGPNGELYGTSPRVGTACFGSNVAACGTVFMLTPPSAPGGTWTATTLYSFGGPPDGADPVNGVVVGPNGELYGTTGLGGTSTACDNPEGCGTVFMLTPPSAPGGTWNETVLHNFTGAPRDGFDPLKLAIGNDGTLYGTTEYGGPFTNCQEGGSISGCGIAFSLAPPSAPGGAWKETVLHNFAGGSDGARPANLAIGQNGVIYGSTGGLNTIFELSPPSSPGGAWTKAVLQEFVSLNTGTRPYGALALGKNGAIYGTTEYGGMLCGAKKTCGTVFELDPPASPGGTWTETLLHAFSGHHDSGIWPLAGLAIDGDGMLYGSTTQGSLRINGGTVFQVRP